MLWPTLAILIGLLALAVPVAAGLGFLQPPDHRRAIVGHDPLLQVDRAEVIDLA